MFLLIGRAMINGIFDAIDTIFFSRIRAHNYVQSWEQLINSVIVLFVLYKSQYLLLYRRCRGGTLIPAKHLIEMTELPLTNVVSELLA